MNMEPIRKDILEYLNEYATDSPDEVFLYNEEYGYTTAELLETVLQVSDRLFAGGVCLGSAVGLSGTRTIEAIILFLAIQKLGAVAILCDPREKTKQYLKSTKTLLKIRHGIDFVDGEWYFDGVRFPILKCTPVSRKYVHCAGSVDSPAFVIFTSGSTGQTKGVVLSQYNYINHMRNFHAVGGNEPGDSAIQMLPIFHIFGMTQIIDGIVHRCPLFFPREITPEYVCECVEKYGFTRFGFVPSFALKMAEAKLKNGYNTDSLKVAVLAGAPSTREQFNFIEETLTMKIVPVYGMSELPGISGAAPTEAAEDRAGSVGKILPMTEVKIEEDGEITVKGPALFLGYFGEAPVDRNAFFPTGDLGYLDEKGFLHITGRKKDIIIRNGNNISSRAIEQKLLSLPFIANAAVVGVTDPDCGEVPVAMVVVREGETYDRAAVAAVLSKPEMPREVRMVNDLPLNATGKIDKQKIKELFS